MWLSPASSKDWGTNVWLLGSSEVGVLPSKYNYGKRKRKVFTRQASSFSTAKYELILHKLRTFHDIFMPVHTSPSVCETEEIPGCWDFSAKTRGMLASNCSSNELENKKTKTKSKQQTKILPVSVEAAGVICLHPELSWPWKTWISGHTHPICK